MASANNGPDWEAVARRELASKVERRAEEVNATAWKAATALQNDCLTREEVSRYRHAVEALIYALEDDVLGRTTEFDGFTGNLPFVRDAGDAADYLDLTMGEVNEAANGFTLDVDAATISDLLQGQAVCVESPEGISVTLQPETAGEVNQGP